MRDWLDKHWRGALAAFKKYADNEHEKQLSKRALHL